MQIVCRFLTSFDFFHVDYPTERVTTRRPNSLVKLRDCRTHWEVHWKDHRKKYRTSKWEAGKVLVRRRLHLVLVQVLPTLHNGPIDILLQIRTFDEREHNGTI